MIVYADEMKRYATRRNLTFFIYIFEYLLIIYLQK